MVGAGRVRVSLIPHQRRRRARARSEPGGEEHGREVGEDLLDGSYLGVCGGVYSFNDFVGTLNAQGHKLQMLQVPPAVYDGFYPDAHEIREVFQYFAEHIYFGPEHGRYIAAAYALVPGGFMNFADWARAHMKAV